LVHSGFARHFAKPADSPAPDTLASGRSRFQGRHSPALEEWSAMTLHFVGETMVCVLCSKVGKSDPRVSSDWRAIVVQGRAFYACTDHFPPDGSPAGKFTDAYTKFLKRVIEILNKSV
jgi:hypothetical protein